MDKNLFEKYVVERYQKQLEWYERRALRNKHWYEGFQVALVLFSSLTPVLIAIDFCASGVFSKWFPIITSVITALIGATLQVFNFHEHWINYRAVAESLRQEWYYYLAEIGEYAYTTDKERSFVNRVESLISQENNTWFSLKKETDSSIGSSH